MSQNNCQSKVRFQTEIEARKNRGWLELENKQKYSVYNCSSCNGWHLASIR
jgi:predicted hydrocarbon binding protein